MLFSGIEREYEQKLMPDGKFLVDGFLCVFDVSLVPNRVPEKQTEFVAQILMNIIKSKKPVVIVATKCDEVSTSAFCYHSVYVIKVTKSKITQITNIQKCRMDSYHLIIVVSLTPHQRDHHAIKRLPMNVAQFDAFDRAIFFIVLKTQ
jgi:hypothetical protein